ncbi:hypothetical protein BDF14DRAFT_1806608 [Spinellus fusiger]|nr:hypothetical protein BDF14DRAFT_1806608 [Spinellus fusiger]
MEKSFAGLLRNSRIATYDRRIPQVYTTSKKNKKVGDWGLKRNLPTVVRTPYVTIGDLDTAEHQSPWQSGQSQVMFLRRWKENFPNSKKPTPRSEQPEYNVALMSNPEFKQFLQQVSKRAHIFREKLANNEVVPEQLFEFFNINFNETPASTIVGPTYSDYEFGWNYPVEGRILNADKLGHVVGIVGVAAVLTRRNSIGLKSSSDRRLRTFYVEKAEIDEQGRPMVTVNMQHSTSSAIPSLLSMDDYGDDKDHRMNIIDTMAADDMFLTQPYKQAHAQDSDGNIRPNPNHSELMERINSLLDLTRNTKTKE